MPEFSSSLEAKLQKCILITCITARFKQPGCVMYKNFEEELLLHAVNGKIYDNEFKLVTGFYETVFNSYRLRGQLEVLSARYKDNCGSV